MYQAGFSSTLRWMTGGVTVPVVAHADQADVGVWLRAASARSRRSIVLLAERRREVERVAGPGSMLGDDIVDQVVDRGEPSSASMSARCAASGPMWRLGELAVVG